MPTQSKKIIILLGDIVVLYLALFLTLLIRYGGDYGSGTFLVHATAFTPLIFLWLVVFFIHNLYEITSAKNTLEFYTNLTRALVINFFVAVLFFYFAPTAGIAPKTNLFIYFIIFAVIFVFWRRQINKILKQSFFNPTVIVASSKSGVKLALDLNQNPQIGYKVMLLVGDHKIWRGVNNQFLPKTLLISNDFDVVGVVRAQKIRSLIIDDIFLSHKMFITALAELLSDQVEIINMSRFNERVWRKVSLENIDEIWFLNNIALGKRTFYEGLKRLSDVAVSLVFLPVAIIVGLMVAVLIKLEDGGPVFYTQSRVGKNGRLFKITKFRTMRIDAELKGAKWTVENDKRVTRLGRLLRKSRLDELPQLLNIIKGEMSFVGPRAERPEFHRLLTQKIPFYERRYLIKPGLTGWAQINYTYGSSVEDTREKLTYDFYYLKNRSFIFDLGIILKTVNIVLSGLGR